MKLAPLVRPAQPVTKANRARLVPTARPATQDPPAGETETGTWGFSTAHVAYVLAPISFTIPLPEEQGAVTKGEALTETQVHFVENEPKRLPGIVKAASQRRALCRVTSVCTPALKKAY